MRSKSTTRTATVRKSRTPIFICTPRARSTRRIAHWARTRRRQRWRAQFCRRLARRSALSVTVAGEFNDWDIRRNPMRKRNGGVWELFIPGLREGAAYKYDIRSQFAGYEQLKADPYAFCCETPPKSASVVWNLDKYQWNDAEWMEARAKKEWLKSPVAAYEVHAGSWMQGLSYREMWP